MNNQTTNIIATDGDVSLRELTTIDLPKLAEYSNNRKVADNLRDAFPHPYTIEDAKRFLVMANEREPKTIFAIEYKGNYCGNTSLTVGIDVHRKNAEVAYFIAEPFWGKGIATRVVTLITAWGFRHLDIVRIYAGVFSFNTASQRVLEKCGFVKEAVFKNAIYKNGRLWDEVRFALLKDDLEN